MIFALEEHYPLKNCTDELEAADKKWHRDYRAALQLDADNTNSFPFMFVRLTQDWEACAVAFQQLIIVQLSSDDVRKSVSEKSESD